MKITKLGHCCLVIEVGDLRILTDPGSYSTAQEDMRDIDIVLITHEHADHFHLPSLKTVLVNNPQAAVYTNASVSARMSAEGLSAEIISHGQSKTVQGIHIEGIGKDHALIHESLPLIENTGYMIAGRLFYPGDALTHPGRTVDVLALPVAGPWLTIGQSIAYATAVKPRIAFPVHDGMLSQLGPVHTLPQRVLNEAGIVFKPLSSGDSTEIA